MTSLALALAMCLALLVPALAEDQSSRNEIITDGEIQVEIQKEETRILSSVYDQLEAQGALGLMDIYKEILIPEIEASVRAQCGMTAITRSANTYALPGGGTIGYTSGLGATVLNTYFTPAQYSEYIGNQSSIPFDFFLSEALGAISYKLGKSSQYLVSLIGGWGQAFAILAALSTYVNNSARNDVANAGFHAEIMNVSADSGTETGSVMIGWDTYANATIPSGSQGIHITRF